MLSEERKERSKLYIRKRRLVHYLKKKKKDWMTLNLIHMMDLKKYPLKSKKKELKRLPTTFSI